MTTTARAQGGASAPEACDILVRNGYVLTVDAKRTVYPSGAVAIRGNRIVAVGPEREVLPRFRPTRVFDAGGAPVHPGMIDGHLHSTCHLTRTISTKATWAAAADAVGVRALLGDPFLWDTVDGGPR